MRSVSSRQNSTVRTFRELAADADREGARILLDGAHLLRDAIAAGIEIEMAAVAASHLQASSEEGMLARQLEGRGVDVILVSDDVFSAISPVRTPSGIVAIATRPAVSADTVCGHPEAFVLAAIDVQDPGNVGSLIRSAEAAGMTGVIIGGASAHPFSWKALRGSMGSALRLPVAIGVDAPGVVDALARGRLHAVASVARGGSDPDTIDWRGRVALLLGGEGPGLPEWMTARSAEKVTIPMAAGVESLNVAVAAGVLAYAARRQRS
jgi:TrmH family RNA methyltransferase